MSANLSANEAAAIASARQAARSSFPDIAGDVIDDIVSIALFDYRRALPQPMNEAKKNGEFILAWSEDIGQWMKVRCVPGGSWPPGLTMWQPMPPDWEEGS